jgi:hypothetical protein
MYRITLKKLGVIFLCLQDCQLGLSASLRYADLLDFYEGRTQTLSGLSADADFLNGGRTQTLSGLSADADFLNGGRTQTLSQLLRSCLSFLTLKLIRASSKRSRIKKPRHFRDRVCAQNRNRTCTTLR